MKARRKIAEANSISLLRYSLPLIGEVSEIMGAISRPSGPAGLSEAATFIHLVMMSNNGDPSEPERRKALFMDGARRFNGGQLIIEKRGGILEMYLAEE